MKQTEYDFSSVELLTNLKNFSSMGITELEVHDTGFATDRQQLLRLIRTAAAEAPDLFIRIPVEAAVVNSEVCHAAKDIYSSLTVFLRGVSKTTDSSGPVYLFDKKLYAKKAALLNDAGLIWGFSMDWAVTAGDSLRFFRDRLDFAISLYPNHIDFEQLDRKDFPAARTTGIFSLQDRRHARDIAFACRTFYTFGRAVPWFFAILAPLKLQCSRFFADFAEWQRCSSCGYGSSFDPSVVPHTEIEKMQLVFLEMKYEEKQLSVFFPAVRDIVRLNGAVSRVVGEGQESLIDTQYDPEDLLGPAASNIVSFTENVCMERCRVQVFAGPDGPDFKILST
ncbi:MAG: hypothetical protein LKF96_11540 [Treponema sp.]|jgi:hypothetical protein|nr:hypothetical protein [Treponema sp.]